MADYWFPFDSDEFASLVNDFGRNEIAAPTIQEPSKEEKRYQYSSSLEILKNYTSSGSRMKCQPILIKESSSHRLSTEEIIKVASQRFIEFSSFMPFLENPFDLYSSQLSNEEIEDIQLADLILASAEKVSNKDFECAARLLRQCDILSSSTGNPVQRLVHHFSLALHKKLQVESKVSRGCKLFDLGEVMNHQPSIIQYYKAVPFSQVEQCAGVQAIVENVTEATQVHVIDLCIRHGMQWTLLMQALALRHENPIKLLTITAVGSISSKSLEDTGKWLMDFARTLKLPFSFKVVSVSDILDLKEEQFEIQNEETVAVYSMFYLWSMIKLSDRLHSLMGVIRNINPCVMVVTEAETNLASASFVRRFSEALFYYGAHFDSLEDCMERNDPHKTTLEYQFSKAIVNLLAAESGERMVQHVSISVWRAFFSQFGMVEQDLSSSSLHQAHLCHNNFSCGSTSCTLTMNKTSLIVGWKGTPLHFVSVWKFE